MDTRTHIYLNEKKKFPKELIGLIWNLITRRTFITWNGKNTSNITFSIQEGLAQGLVNSLKLFNIYTCNVLNLFKLNQQNNTYSIAYADDTIFYIAGANPAEIQPQLEQTINKINNYYTTWNLRINPSKCETILFRQPSRLISDKKRKEAEEFSITTFKPDSREPATIPTKKTVKYLGMNIDYLMRCFSHVDTQLTKARNTYKALARLFHDSRINNRARVICYMLLIRPIITYACPIWWNIGAAQAEKLRKFERACLRATLGLYRKKEGDNIRSITNKHLYETADITRIDNFIIKQTRDYYSQLPNINNRTIQEITRTNIDIQTATSIGYIQPQAFTYLDKIVLIQNEANVPTLYHRSRHKANKKIPIDEYARNGNNNLKYSTAIPSKDSDDFHRLLPKYWWLEEDAAHTRNLKRRKEQKEAEARRRAGHAHRLDSTMSKNRIQPIKEALKTNPDDRKYCHTCKYVHTLLVLS